MRCCLYALLVSVLMPISGVAQILLVTELSSRDIAQLDRDETVVILPGGIIEEHGPYLPSFTDGYFNEWFADRLAEAILAERGGTVLKFPTIPLGAGTAEDFGGHSSFSGSYAVRPETLRAVYMDLASSLGEDGFRTIFLLNRHGAPSHNQALRDAAEYFNDRFDGTMVLLTSLLRRPSTAPPSYLDPDELRESAVDVHGGELETSQMLFLHPGLVHDDYKVAQPFSAASMNALTEIAAAPGWLGYFGSPRLATPAAGAQMVEFGADQMIELALQILDGFDWRGLLSLADVDPTNASLLTAIDNTTSRAEQERRRQEEWINAQQR